MTHMQKAGSKSAIFHTFLAVFLNKFDEIYTTNLRGVPFVCAPPYYTPRILSHRRPEKFFFVIFRKSAKKGMKHFACDAENCLPASSNL